MEATAGGQVFGIDGKSSPELLPTTEKNGKIRASSKGKQSTDGGETEKGSRGVGKGLYRPWRGEDRSAALRLARVETAAVKAGLRASIPAGLMGETVEGKVN